MRRTIDIQSSEIRADQNSDGAKTIRGTASLYDVEYEVGGWWVEVFRSGAFRKSVNDSPNIMVLNQHNSSQPLGSTRARTAKVWEDEAGLHYEAALPNTTFASDAFESISRRDVQGSSIEFEVVTGKERWTPNGRGDLDLREIFEAKLYEVSPVTFPASPATTAGIRANVGAAERELRDTRRQAADTATTEEPRATRHSAAGAEGATTEEPSDSEHSAAGARAVLLSLQIEQYELERSCEK